MRLITTFLNDPADPERPTVASDMEGTLSAGVTWKGLRNYLLAHGRKEDYDRFFRANLYKLPLYYLGWINPQKFKQAWIGDIFHLFNGFSRPAFDEVAEWVVEHEHWPRRRRGIIAELEQHLAQGRRVVVVSGLIEPILGRFAARVGLEAIGTPVKYSGDLFSGKTAGPMITGQQKAGQLAYFSGPDKKIEAAYGDTLADVPMLSMSRLPTAVAPDKKLRRVARANGWRIIDGE